MNSQPFAGGAGGARCVGNAGGARATTGGMAECKACFRAAFGQLILQPKGKLFRRRAATQQVATESGCLRRIPALKAGSRIFRVGRQVKRIPMNSSVIDAIGNTPLIRLRKASEATGCEILGKAEFMNPGQSVKDRAGLFIIRDAEQRGLLKPGGVIVEGTAGNTGIGLTLVA